MLINEFYKPKIDKRVTAVAGQYYDRRHDTRHQLTGGYNYTQNNNWLRENLVKLGWYKIGSGGYSLVFENPKKNYVLKVSTNSNDGYDKFVKIIHQHRNIHFPKISDRKEFTFKPNNQWEDSITYPIYLIERLHSIPEPYNDNYASIVSVIMSIYSEEMNPSMKLVMEILKRDYFTDTEFTNVKEFMDKNPLLIKAAAILGNAQKYHKVNNDLHAKNIMQREDGTIVIIDPYV